MPHETERDQEMERWARRLRFYRENFLLDGVCPTLGVIGGVWLVASGSDSLAALGACLGAVGVRWVGAGADLLADTFRKRR